MKIKMTLPTVRSDRERVTQTSSFLCKTNRVSRHFRRTPNRFGEIEMNVGYSSNSKRKFHENVYWNTFAQNMYSVFVQNTSVSKSNEQTWITFRYDNGDSIVMMRKDGNSIYMNGVKKNQVDVAMALANIIGFGAINRCADAMDNYIDRNVTYSSNILYSLENRTPYWLFEDGRKVQVKINTSLIGRDEVAFEISENIWGSLSLDEANTFIDCYRNKAKRSKKWANISPSNLWFNMFGTHATESQEQLMKAWLMQNRTDWIVEERAFKLLKEMDEKDQYTLVDTRKLLKYADIELNGLSTQHNFAMHVRGELGDWLVYPNNRATGSQRCSVVFFKKMNSVDGPFCIDDVNGKNVMGDQIATRATLVFNDKVGTKIVRTLQSVSPTGFRVPNNILRHSRFTEEITWR